MTLAPSSSAAPDLDVLLITADQLRGDCLGHAGHPHVRTPHLDALAAEGTAFLAHWGQAAPCGPARAALYTGLYQMRNRVVANGAPLAAHHDTIARLALRHGYRPTLFGYTDQAEDPAGLAPADPRLHSYEGVLPGFFPRLAMPEDAGAWRAALIAKGYAQAADIRTVHLPRDGRTDPPTGAPTVYAADEAETAFVADAYLRWLDEIPREAPYFAHVSFLRPHPPLIAPEPYASMHDPAEGGPFVGRESAQAEAALHPFLAWHLPRIGKGSLVAGARGPISDWGERERRVLRATYWGLVAEVDAAIGRIVADLKRRGRYERTLIVFTADHGEMLGDHHAFGKFGFFDAAFHVPLVVRDPRRPAGHGRRVEAFTEAVDVMPTIAEALGEALPGADGRALTPFLAGETPEGWRDAVHWEYDFRTLEEPEPPMGLDRDACSLAVRRERDWKYVHFAGLPPLLFDLAGDPHETIDRADDPACAGIRLRMAEALLSWRARHLERRYTGMLLTERGPLGAPR
ncbi:alkaline phosphatase family protein [Salinarimonas chemoclinalis]|uniref:alkaline phosphatase family protein n=1 Tax=Salinarimonas chemoclinalis TaxID=3241599 RepID=UPI0035563965